MNENYHYILTKELVVEVYEQVYSTYEEAYTRLKHEYEETESNELNDYGNMKENEAYVKDCIPEIKVHDIDVEAQDLEYHWKIHKVADS